MRKARVNAIRASGKTIGRMTTMPTACKIDREDYVVLASLVPPSFAGYPFCFLSTFAHVSFSAMVRLNTGLPGFESASTQKYPRRSNW